MSFISYESNFTNKVLTFLFSAFLVVIATFRFPGFTPDTIAYFNLTKTYLNDALMHQIEPFHILLMYILSIFELDYYTVTQLIFFIYASISIMALNTAYNAFNLQTKLPLYLYFFTTFIYLNLIQIRWGLAVSIIVLGISQLKTSRLRSLSCIFIASFIHSFAIIALPIFLIPRFKFKIISYIIIPVSGLFLGKFFNPDIIKNIITDIDFIIFENYKNNIILKIQYYFDVDRIKFKDNPINLISIFFLMSYILTLLVSKFVNRTIFYVYLNTLCFLIFLYFYFLDISIFSRRLMYLLVPISIPLLVYSSYFYKQGLILRGFTFLFSILILVNFIFIKELIRF